VAGFAGAEAANTVAGAVLISGVYELAPIAASYVNDVVGMDADDVAKLSPMRAKPMRDIPTQILIGSDESDAFQWQSNTLHDLWSPHVSRLTLLRPTGRDHFDILDELTDPTSPSFTSILEMAQ
jgi:arylformamidase